MRQTEHWDDAKKFLRGTVMGRAIYSFAALPSTQAPAKEAARCGEPEGAVWVADAQTAGRGRHGRTWVSGAGTALTFSLLVRPRIEARYAPLLSAAAACAALRAVREVAPTMEAAIKWPNDLLARGRKFCGMICESATRGAAIEWAVIGIGVNVLEAEADLPEPDSPDRPRPTSMLVETGEMISRTRLLAAMLDALGDMIPLAESEEGRRAIVREYERSCVTIGQTIRVITDGGEHTGRAVGAGELCELAVETSGGVMSFAAADVARVRTKGGDER